VRFAVPARLLVAILFVTGTSAVPLISLAEQTGATLVGHVVASVKPLGTLQREVAAPTEGNVSLTLKFF
jgi:hypothetical protein